MYNVYLGIANTYTTSLYKNCHNPQIIILQTLISIRKLYIKYLNMLCVYLYRYVDCKHIHVKMCEQLFMHVTQQRVLAYVRIYNCVSSPETNAKIIAYESRLSSLQSLPQSAVVIVMCSDYLNLKCKPEMVATQNFSLLH